MISIENHLEVYVDSEGRVCLAQPSMDETCEIALEPQEAETLIMWLQDALNEAIGNGDSQHPRVANIEADLVTTP